MNFLYCSPINASTFCSSDPVPKVVTARAWVSPRVNKADPWVRGNIFTSHVIGRMSAGLRPSTRRFSRTTIERRVWLVRSSKTASTSFSRPAYSSARTVFTSSFTVAIAAARSCLAITDKAARSLSAARSRTRSIRTVSGGTATRSRFCLPATRAISSWTSRTGLTAYWARNNASSMSSSDTIRPPPSTMAMVSRPAATKRLMSLVSNWLCRGFTTRVPPSRPMRTPAIGP